MDGQKSPDDLLTIKEVVEQYPISDKTVRRWIKERKVIAQRFGEKIIVIRREEIEKQMRPVN